MKKLRLNQLIIISHKEKKGKHIKFTDGKNIIIGKNNTGKSLLIRLIFEALGAETHIRKEELDAINPLTLLDFSISEENFLFFKINKEIYLFDYKLNLIKSFKSVTNELSPFFAEKLNIKLKLSTAQKELSFPTPNILFLPFFIDQDNSWYKYFNSFKRLTQFKDWTKSFGDYLSGKNSNQLIEINENLFYLKNETKELEPENIFLNQILDNHFNSNNFKLFNYSIAQIESETVNLREEIQKLRKQEFYFKSKLIELYNEKIFIENQIKITQNEIKNLNSDLMFLSEQSVELECPICGTIHENNFESRLSIAVDSGNLNELLLELIKNKTKKEKEIKNFETKKQNIIEKLTKINNSIYMKNTEDNITDILVNEGKKLVSIELKEKIINIETKISKNKANIKDLQKDKRKISNKNKINNTKINNSFIKRLENNFKLLDIEKINPLEFNFYKTPNLSGSRCPRSILAYYYSILNTIYEYENYFIAPLVIDTPNQQGQDKVNIEKIYEFIKNNHIKDTQLLLGTEDLKDVKFDDANYIILEKKFELLNKKDYKFSKLFEVLVDKIIENENVES